MRNATRATGLPWTLLAAALACGCEETPQVADAQVPQGMSTRSTPLPESASPERSCTIPAVLPPGGIVAVDTSLTPRANVAAEILAMEASGELVAPQALYERVVHELFAITGSSSGSWGAYVGCGVQTDLLVGMTDAGKQQVENGQYTAWNDYNATLRVAGPEQKFYGYKLAFDGVYNIAALAQAYGQLPEVRYAEGNGFVGGSGGACLERFGDANDTHVYIFWSGSGDCPAGCINKTYWGYSAEASGAVEYLGSHSGGNEPDWFTKARQCRNFL